MDALDSLPLAVRIVLGVVAVLVLAGVVAGVLQTVGKLPHGWSAERFRSWFARRRDDGDR